jgi:hypothetical protein
MHEKPGSELISFDQLSRTSNLSSTRTTFTGPLAGEVAGLVGASDFMMLANA